MKGRLQTRFVLKKTKNVKPDLLGNKTLLGSFDIIAVRNQTYALFELKDSCETPDITEHTCLSKDEIGHGPSSKNSAPIILYCIHENEFYHSHPCKAWLSRVDYREVGAFFKKDDFYAKSHLVHSPMSDLLYGREVSPCRATEVLEGISKESISLHLSFFRRDLCFHETTGIIAPHLKLSRFIDLALKSSCITKTCSSLTTMKIKELTVVLQELIATQTDHKLKYRLCNYTLLQKNLDQLINWDKKKNEFSLNDLLVGGEIPAVGPSYFSNHTWRTYGIKVVVVLSIGGSRIKLSVFKEAAIACQNEVHRGISKNSQSPPNRLFVNFAQFSRSGSSLHDVFSHNRRELSSHSQLGYHTDTFFRGDKILAITVGMAAAPQNYPSARTPLLLEMHRLGLEDFGNEPKLNNESYYIICKEVTSGKLHRFHSHEEENSFLGMVLIFREHQQRFEFPSRRLPFQAHYGVTRKGSGLSMKGSSYRLFLSNYRVLLIPGDDLSIAFKLCLTVEAQHNRARPEVEYSVLVSQIDLMEIIRGSNSKGVYASIERKHQHMKRNYNPSEMKLINSGSHTKSFPSTCYNFAMPSYGPTFFTEDLIRTYELLFHFELMIGGESEQVHFTFSVDLAANDDPESHDIPPPSYEEANNDSNHGSKSSFSLSRILGKSKGSLSPKKQ
ncbi:hypothetical protein ACI3LY_004113 [Candidozyma auris]|nr:hypothetical protein QG37_06464 [[Candida] auris]